MYSAHAKVDGTKPRGVEYMIWRGRENTSTVEQTNYKKQAMSVRI
jgi:hypothetical protein